MIGPSNINPQFSWWNTFLRVKIPMKVKMFIWKARQDWIPTKINIGRRAKKHNMFEVVSWSIHYLQEFQSSRPQLQGDVGCGNRFTCRWIPPELDAYKANCDAVLDHGNGTMGIWMIIRNSGGQALASCSLVSEGTINVKVAKLMATLKCLQFGIDCGLTLGNIETDEANVVKWLQNDCYLDSDFGLIISEIMYLRDKIGGVAFSCNRQVANNVADKLALYTLRNRNDSYWMADYPLCLRKDLEADMPV
ncbi:hypothetical protein Dsin_015850 [Dipteronia sinensis]|uniref:RNase H type-1 domain-containing protein n=1 Tax=Dipteronia sinensis TaxID=43782 RepID=A0AAE0E528_9ROSI|nr:hypothetical protein Dsin_015850 [Dipteronia sinensis]